jgi:uncharacterized membrane protein
MQCVEVTTMTHKLISGVVLATLLSGCVTTENAVRSDPPAPAGTDDQTATKVQGTVLGAVMGGLIGAATGDTKGALIGATVGAGLGYVAGSEVAKRKAQYVREEDFLDAEIAQARELNSEAIAYNATLRRQIAALDSESAQLAAKYRSGKASRDQMIAQRNTVQARLQKSQEVESSLRKEHEIKVAVVNEERGQRGADDPYVKSLDAQVKELQTNIDNLHQGSTQLARIDERLSV